MSTIVPQPPAAADAALAAAPPRAGASVEARVVTVEAGRAKRGFDRLAAEEPLEIRVRAGGETRSLAITMRTPGADFELAAGFLHAEGVTTNAPLLGITYCLGDDAAEQRYNVVVADLAGSALPDLAPLERHFTTTSACGVCGAASLEVLRARGMRPIDDALELDAATIVALPERLRARQRVFAQTGGLHAAALFDADGSLLAVREDVGRHNAFDKLVGWAAMRGMLPLAGRVVLVSGRASYELVQKALAAGVPALCAVSAPSSLAVELAREFGLTLAGFVRGERFVLYAGERRVRDARP